MKVNKHRISATVDKEIYEKFEEIFPNCLSKFIRNCMFLALKNREFFMSVFFKKEDK